MNTKFSIEDIFNLVKMQNNSVGIEFIHTSDVYRRHPNGVTLNHITNCDQKGLIANIAAKTFTYGSIEGIGFDNMPQHDDEIELKFSTYDIYAIEYYCPERN